MLWKFEHGHMTKFRPLVDTTQKFEFEGNDAQRQEELGKRI